MHPEPITASPRSVGRRALSCLAKVSRLLTRPRVSTASIPSTNHEQLTHRGVHCALAMVNGFVGPDSDATNPTNIANQCWDLYISQGHGRMELETQINEREDEDDEDGLAYIRQWNLDHPFEM